MTLRQKFFNQPYLLLVLTVLFWSANVVLSRGMNDVVPPIGLAFWRWMLGFLIVLPLVWSHLIADIRQAMSAWPWILVLTATGIGAYNTLVYVGLQTTQAINALLMQPTMPVMIAVAAFLLFRDRIRPLQVLGIAVSLVGVVVIVSRGDLQQLAGLQFTPGDLWVLTALVCYALYSIFLRKRPPMRPLGFVAITFLLGALMLLPFYLWETFAAARPVLWDRTETWVTIGYVAVFPSVLSFLFFNRGVELVGANTAGQFVYLMPVFGSIMAVLFLGERFALFHVIGITCIVCGIVLATRNARREPAPAPNPREAA